MNERSIEHFMCVQVKRIDITTIDMLDRGDFCVRFHLKNGGHIIFPCFYEAGFPIEDYPDLMERQLELTREYLDRFSDDEFVELSAAVLYNMNVYH